MENLDIGKCPGTNCDKKFYCARYAFFQNENSWEHTPFQSIEVTPISLCKDAPRNVQVCVDYLRLGPEMKNGSITTARLIEARNNVLFKRHDKDLNLTKQISMLNRKLHP